MKTIHRLLMLIVITCLMACKPDPKQDLSNSRMPVTIYSNQVHVITLYVNTTDIQNPNVGDYADFGQASGISNEDYTTYVQKGDIVIWNGVSTTNPLDIVNISKINHHSGKQLFGKNVLQGNGGDNEMVVGVITADLEPEEGAMSNEEKYVLHFKVKRDGQSQVHSFKIDPYIKMSQ